MKRPIATLVLSLNCFTIGATWAGDFEDAENAYDKKDYSVALAQFKLAATKGLNRAQF